jgi:ASC-1-like (ASCH) protein
MFVNFSQEELELPKSTIFGVPGDVSASLVAVINDIEFRDSSGNVKARREVNSVVTYPLFKEYLKEKLEHSNTEERTVMEPVLRVYRHVFHQEGSNDFKGSALVEHKIVTGEARPIRKARTWYRFS